MRARSLSLVLALMVLTTAVADPEPAAAAVTLGANAGVNFMRFEQPDNLSDIDDLSETVVSAPGYAPAVMPGLRVGYLRRDNRLGVNGDVGVARSGDPGGETYVDGLLSIEYSARATAPTRPFLGAGLGLHYTHYRGITSSRPVFGAGIGVRHRLTWSAP